MPVPTAPSSSTAPNDRAANDESPAPTAAYGVVSTSATASARGITAIEP